MSIDREEFKRHCHTMLQTANVEIKHCKYCQEPIIFLPVRVRKNDKATKWFIFDMYLENHFQNCSARQQQRDEREQRGTGEWERRRK